MVIAAEAEASNTSDRLHTFITRSLSLSRATACLKTRLLNDHGSWCIACAACARSRMWQIYPFGLTQSRPSTASLGAVGIGGGCFCCCCCSSCDGGDGGGIVGTAAADRAVCADDADTNSDGQPREAWVGEHPGSRGPVPVLVSPAAAWG